MDEEAASAEAAEKREAAPVENQQSVSESERKVAPLTNLIPVWIVDSKPPFPRLALYKLVALPRSGDKILVNVGKTNAIYRVVEVNFDPFDANSHAYVLCSPDQSDAASNENTDLKKQMDEHVKSTLEFFGKAEGLNRTIILLGYAGIFAVWGFVKDNLSPQASVWSAVLVGISLVIYITYNVLVIIHSAFLQSKMAKFSTDDASLYFRQLHEFNVERRKKSRRDLIVWLIQIVPTLAFGYAGAILLLYNCLAKVAHLPAFP